MRGREACPGQEFYVLKVEVGRKERAGESSQVLSWLCTLPILSRAERRAAAVPGASTRAPLDPGAMDASDRLPGAKDGTVAVLGMVPWALRPSQQAYEVGTLYSHLASEETEVQR